MNEILIVKIVRWNVYFKDITEKDLEKGIVFKDIRHLENAVRKAIALEKKLKAKGIPVEYGINVIEEDEITDTSQLITQTKESQIVSKKLKENIKRKRGRPRKILETALEGDDNATI